MNVIEKIEKANFEDFIMDKLRWTKEQKEFLGTLIFNIEDENGDEISVVVAKRFESKFSISYIYPNIHNEEATEFVLVYDKDKRDVDYTKTTDNVDDFNEAKLFVETISELVKETQPVFYPDSKIKNDNIKNNSSNTIS